MRSMIGKYIEGKGIHIGTFTAEDINSGACRTAVRTAKARSGLRHTNTEYVRSRSGRIMGLAVYVCRPEDAAPERRKTA